MGIALLVFSHDREVLDWCRRAEELDPDAFLTAWLRQLAHMSPGEWDEAMAAGKVALERSGGTAFPEMFLELSYNTNPDLRTGPPSYDELLARSAHEYVAPGSLAALAAALGNRDAVLRHLEDATRRHDPTVVIFARGWPAMEPLHALPEYQAILRDIGVTQWAERER